MTAESLNEVKDRLRSRYLGREGIHGFGLRRTENAVCVYLAPQVSRDRQDLLDEIQREAAPFKLIAIVEEPPKLA